jgi:hypothetical protein
VVWTVCRGGNLLIETLPANCVADDRCDADLPPRCRLMPMLNPRLQSDPRMLRLWGPQSKIMSAAKSRASGLSVGKNTTMQSQSFSSVGFGTLTPGRSRLSGRIRIWQKCLEPFLQVVLVGKPKRSLRYCAVAVNEETLWHEPHTAVNVGHR